MIWRNPPETYEVACDGCSSGCDAVEAQSFRSAITKLIRLGWSITRHKGEVEHFCPDCTAEERQKEGRAA